MSAIFLLIGAGIMAAVWVIQTIWFAVIMCSAKKERRRDSEVRYMLAASV